MLKVPVHLCTFPFRLRPFHSAVSMCTWHKVPRGKKMASLRHNAVAQNGTSLAVSSPIRVLTMRLSCTVKLL